MNGGEPFVWYLYLTHAQRRTICTITTNVSDVWADADLHGDGPSRHKTLVLEHTTSSRPLSYFCRFSTSTALTSQVLLALPSIEKPQVTQTGRGGRQPSFRTLAYHHRCRNARAWEYERQKKRVLLVLLLLLLYTRYLVISFDTDTAAAVSVYYTAVITQLQST